MAKPLGTVGIMALPKSGKYPFGESGYFRELTLAGRRLGLRVIVFNPMEIDWNRRVVRCNRYVPGIGWRTQVTRVPDVVYDRLFPGRAVWAQCWRSVRRLRRSRRVILMGRGLQGKWQMYLILRKYPDIKPYLPETHLLKRPETLARMAARYKIVFVKPMFGSQGRGVKRVVRQQGGFRVYMGRANLSRLTTAQGIMDSTRGRTYLVQQGLSLNYLPGGSTFDVRVIVQKNGQGEWQVSGMAARVGQRGSITSNLHTGGRARQVRALLRRYHAEQADSILAEINALAVRVAAVMDKTAGPLCDLGLDLGVDRNGKVWIIEANSKPGRKVFRLMGDLESRRRVVETPMEYARFLLLGKRGEPKEWLS